MAATKYQLKVLEKKNLVDRYWSVRFERPEGFTYTAGQYISILVSERGERRSYSLASWPSENYLEIIFDVKPGGLGSGLLLSLEPGKVVEALAPLGMFVVSGLENLSKDRKLLLVGTGTGIVPLRSMIHDLLETKGFLGEMRFHWGMRSDRELFLVEEFDQLKNRFSNFGFDIVLSQPSEIWPSCKGHVQDCLVSQGTNWTGWEAYICGNQKMIMDVAALLQTKGIVKEKIYFEKFY